MFLSSRQTGWSSRQQKQQAHLDAIMFITAKRTHSGYITIRYPSFKKEGNKYHLLTESEVITGKSQTEALMY